MEVEISGKSLDCSRYLLIAVVADDSHVGSPHGKGARTNWALVYWSYHFLCHNEWAARNAKMGNNPNKNGWKTGILVTGGKSE